MLRRLDDKLPDWSRTRSGTITIVLVTLALPVVLALLLR
jgi:hypothetical protein